jgi:hypothetical protein
MRFAAAMATVALAGLLAGCELVTGDTSGYELQEAGPACSSSADCGDAGVCCLSLTASGSGSLGSGPACRPTCSLLPGVSLPQLCAQSSECKSDAACTRQSCSGDSGAPPIQACGLLLGCQAQ